MKSVYTFWNYYLIKLTSRMRMYDTSSSVKRGYTLFPLKKKGLNERFSRNAHDWENLELTLYECVKKPTCKLRPLPGQLQRSLKTFSFDSRCCFLLNNILSYTFFSKKSKWVCTKGVFTCRIRFRDTLAWMDDVGTMWDLNTVLCKLIN